MPISKLAICQRVAIDDYPTREELATGHVVQSMATKLTLKLLFHKTILNLVCQISEAVIKEAESFKEPSEQDRKGRRFTRFAISHH